MTRRSLLAGLGASSALLPFVPVLDSHAETTGFPKRLILFYTPSGCRLQDWRPSGGENDFQLSTILRPLAEGPRDYTSDLLILDGIDNESSYHAPGGRAGHRGVVSIWTGWEMAEGDALGEGSNATGWPKGPSVDQFIADNHPEQTPLHHLALGVQPHEELRRMQMIHRAANEPVEIEDDPYRVFDKIFGELSLDPTERLRMRDRRLRVIDAVNEDLTALRGRVGAADRIKLDAHLTNLEGVQDLVSQVIGEGCTQPVLPGGVDIGSRASMPEVGTMQMSLIASAMACDLTRVASIIFDSEGRAPSFGWLGHSENYHQLSHAENGQFTECWQWYATKFRELLDMLAAVPEGDGTMLDNTAVVWGSAIGRSGPHAARNIPLVIAGSCGGYFRTGRYLRYGNYPASGGGHDAHGGQPLNNVLVSLCNAMGLDQVDTFGNPSYCDGPLSDLT